MKTIKTLLGSRMVWCGILYFVSLIMFCGSSDKQFNLLFAVFGAIFFEVLAVWFMTERPSKADQVIKAKFFEFCDNVREDWD